MVEQAAGLCRCQAALVHYFHIVHVLGYGGRTLVRGVLHRVQKLLDHILDEVDPVGHDVYTLLQDLGECLQDRGYEEGVGGLEVARHMVHDRKYAIVNLKIFSFTLEERQVNLIALL